MTKRVSSCVLVCALAALLCATGAQAGGFIGASAGTGSTEIDNGAFDSSSTAYKIHGGYRFLQFFGVEADYRDFGNSDDTVQGSPVEVDSTAFDVFAVGVVPLGLFEVFCKAGVTAWDMELQPLGQSSLEDDGNDLAYGVGAAFKMSKFALRLEYEQFDINDSEDVRMASVGFDFRF